MAGEQFLCYSSHAIKFTDYVAKTVEEPFVQVNHLANEHIINDTYVQCTNGNMCYLSVFFNGSHMDVRDAGCMGRIEVNQDFIENLSQEIQSPDCRMNFYDFSTDAGCKLIGICYCTSSACNVAPEHLGSSLQLKYDKLCNPPTTVLPVPGQTPGSEQVHPGALVAAVASLSLLLLLLLLVALLYFKVCSSWRFSKFRFKDFLLKSNRAVFEEQWLLPEVVGSAQLVHTGRYGHVLILPPSGVNGEKVAAKVFQQEVYSEFLNEVTIYRLLQEELNYVQFTPRYLNSSDKIIQMPEGVSGYVLLLEACEESLRATLIRRTLNWRQFVKLVRSFIAGLAYIHSRRIVHRDLSSQNVLCRMDGSCVIADFAYSLWPAGHTATQELQDCGTLNYLAPELLDGSINLHTLQTSLQAVDVYAAALILWETANRCTELSGPREYQVPFSDLHGDSRVTFQSMQALVFTAGLRPATPAWPSEATSLLQTIMDAWDADPEARVTADCVLQRLENLPEQLANPLKGRDGLILC